MGNPFKRARKFMRRLTGREQVRLSALEQIGPRKVQRPISRTQGAGTVSFTEEREE